MSAELPKVPEEKDYGQPSSAMGIRLEKTHGCIIPVFIGKDDKPETLRKFLARVGDKSAELIYKTYMENPDDYDIEIAIAMRKSPRA